MAMCMDRETAGSGAVITGKPAEITARITRISHPLYLLEAEIAQYGKVNATAKGKFYHQPDLDSVCY